jgi:hypothetical protein
MVVGGLPKPDAGMSAEDGEDTPPPTGPAAPGAMTTAFDHLAQDPRWVAWRNEQRGDKVTKVPYSPVRKGRARADDPATWGNRDQATATCSRIVNGLGGGIGIELGPCAPDVALGGVDLDTCRTPDGKLEPWAQQVIDRFLSYAEISPSQTGVKVFFHYAAEELGALRTLLGEQDGRQFKRRSGGDHPPGIELYVDRRYFAVTQQHLIGTPADLRFVSFETLRWLIEEAGPAFQGGRYGKDRSAIAFRKGAALRRQGVSFDQMCDALRRDPETADWVREKGEANGGRELRRIWERSGQSSTPPPAPQQVIRVAGGLRHEAADAGLDAMHAANVAFYQRDRTLVRVCLIKAKASDGTIISVPGIALVTLPVLTRALGQSARWEKINSKGILIRIDPPKEVAEQIAGMVGEWPFVPLAGVIATPTLRPDGSLLTAEGYDPVTGLVLLGPPPMPAIPDAPSRREAEEALGLLDDLLQEFPFVDRASRSVALSMLMTPVLRGALAPAVPMHLTTAPQAGTGKSYLADLASAIAVGERCAVMAVAPNPEETEKRLVGAALAGFPIIALDNCSAPLAGDFLCQVTERPMLQLRALGSSALVRVANSFTTFVNGNHASVVDDVVRRTLTCMLDADMENPEERSFKKDPLARVLTDRGSYIRAILVIARAYIVIGRPDRRHRLPSFERWSDTVRSALCWLGRADPVDTIGAARAEDPVRQARTAVFSAWARELNLGTGYLTTELVTAAEETFFNSNAPLRPTLRDAFLAVARERRSGEPRIAPVRLGKWLGKASNTVAAGHKLTVDRQDISRLRWILEKR